MFCEICKNRICLIIKKPCLEVNKILPKPHTGKINNKEISVNPLEMDKSFYFTSGRKKAIRYSDNYDLI
jgi:hypothetical protein